MGDSPSFVRAHLFFWLIDYYPPNLQIAICFPSQRDFAMAIAPIILCSPLDIALEPLWILLWCKAGCRCSLRCSTSVVEMIVTCCCFARSRPVVRTYVRDDHSNPSSFIHSTLSIRSSGILMENAILSHHALYVFIILLQNAFSAYHGQEIEKASNHIKEPCIFLPCVARFARDALHK